MKVFPPGYRKRYLANLKFAREKQHLHYWLALPILLGLVLGFLIYLIPFGVAGITIPWLAWAIIICPIIGHLASNLIIYFKKFKISSDSEKALPDFLQLVAINLKSGMLPFQAIRASARPDFGPLAEEIQLVSKQALGTESFRKNLYGIKDKIDSVTISRVIKLLTSALTTGGNIGKLLLNLSNDIRDTFALKAELVSKTKTYSAFIMFTVLFITPVLFTISIHFVDTISSLPKIEAGAGDDFGVGFLGGEVLITSDFLFWLSIVTLSLTATFSGVLMGVISEGKFTYGLRYAPILIPVALAVFFASRKVISSMIGTF